MKNMGVAIILVAIAGFYTAPAEAGWKGGCRVSSLAGEWIFATSIGRQMLGGPFPPDKDITALGTMHVNRDGSVSGKFDVTVEDTIFLPDVGFDGSITLERDCTGTLTFVTAVGSVRTDSIALVAHDEALGMSQDPANLWTYQMRRIGRGSRD